MRLRKSAKLVVVAGLIAPLSWTGSSMAEASEPPAGGLFTPANATLFDSATSAQGGLSTAGQWTAVRVGSIADIPDSAHAVQLSVQVTGAEGSGSLYVQPAGATASAAPLLSYDSATPVSNGGIVMLGTNASIAFKTDHRARVRITANGFYAGGSTAAGGFKGINPENDFGSSTPVSAGYNQTARLANGDEIPRTATAVAVRIRVEPTAASTADGQLWIGPANAPRSAGSTFNWSRSQPAVFSAIITVSGTGQAQLVIDAGDAVYLEVMSIGYFLRTADASQAAGAIFYGAGGAIYDSKSSTALAPGETRTVPFRGVGSLPASAAGVTGLAVNFTYSSTGSGSVEAWANYASSTAQAFVQSDRPTSSFAILRLTGKDAATSVISVRNDSASPVHVRIDSQGWFASLPAPTFACSAPANGWTAAIPADGLQCTVSLPAINVGNAYIELFDESTLVDYVPVAANSPTSMTFRLPVHGGTPMRVRAVLTAGDEQLSSSAIFVTGFGDWFTAEKRPLPYDGAAVGYAPELSVDLLPDAWPVVLDGQITVSENADGKTAPVASGSFSTGYLQIAENALKSGQKYYWTGVVNAYDGMRKRAQSVTLPVWSFTFTPGSSSEEVILETTSTYPEETSSASARVPNLPGNFVKEWKDFAGAWTGIRTEYVAKMANRHNITATAVYVSATKYPNGMRYASGAGNARAYEATFQRRNAKTRRVISSVKVRVVHGLKHRSDGKDVSIISAYCIGYNPRCPSWVNNTL